MRAVNNKLHRSFRTGSYTYNSNTIYGLYLITKLEVSAITTQRVYWLSDTRYQLQSQQHTSAPQICSVGTPPIPSAHSSHSFLWNMTWVTAIEHLWTLCCVSVALQRSILGGNWWTTINWRESKQNSSTTFCSLDNNSCTVTCIPVLTIQKTNKDHYCKKKEFTLHLAWK